MASPLSSKGEISIETTPCVYVEWKVPDIHFFPQDTDHKIYSPTFHFKDVAWYLRLTLHSPKPYDEFSDSIDLHLLRKDPGSSAICVNYHIGIKKVDGTTYPSYIPDSPFIFERECWGKACIISRSNLSQENAIVAPNGAVKFFCHFWVEHSVNLYASSRKNRIDDQSKMMTSQISQNTGEISTKRTAIMYVEWKVPGIHLLSEDTKHMFRSPRFQFNEETWYLQATIHDTKFRPCGICGPIDFHLGRMDCATPTRYVACNIGIKLVDGGIFKPRVGELIFDRNVDSHAWTNLVSRLNEKIIQAPNGDVTFFCSLGFDSVGSLDACSRTEMSEGNTSEKSTAVSTSAEASAPSLGHQPKKPLLSGTSKLIKDFQNLFISGEGSDLIINVKGTEFRVHKSILLARSTVFLSMLSHDMVEKNTGTIDIIDCEPEAFKIFLVYLYNGCVEDLSMDIACDLYRVAHKYDTEELKFTCTEFMMSDLSADTVCDVIEHALLYNDEKLLNSATNYFARNFKSVILTVKWQSFMKKNTVAANELLIKASNLHVLKE